MKINKPTWMKGNIIGAFHNGNLFSNNISEILIAVYNDNKIIENEVFEAAIEFKFENDIRLIASLKSKSAVLKTEGKILDEFQIDYQFSNDDNSIMLKLSFDIKNDKINIPTGNHYFIVIFEKNEKLISSLIEKGIPIEGI